MTARQRLNRRKWWLQTAGFGGIGLIGAGLALGPQPGVQPVMALFVPGLVVFVASSLVATWVALRCPWCRANLGVVLAHAGLWRIDPKVQYCPFCGCDLDWKLSAASE